MSTYVFSDVHGHIAPLERVLDRLELGEDDKIFCLGDMIDRGPDPVGVLKLVRDLPNCTVLLGNHEDMMLSFFDYPNDPMTMTNWSFNGGMKTARGLSDLGDEQMLELVEWVRSLPRWAYTEAGGRGFLLVHAGIDPRRLPDEIEPGYEGIEKIMEEQLAEDLVWIREPFWERPTGLLDENGEGVIVITGHTPTLYLDGMNVRLDRSPREEDGRCRMVRVGASEATGGVADKWDIDCGCAGGSELGQVLVLRLDDGQEFTEPVLKGE